MKSQKEQEQFKATVVDIYDPNESGRYKIRVHDVHSSELPIEQLPWSTVDAKLGSGKGRGSSINILKKQVVNVRPVTAGHSEWVITSGTTFFEQEGGEYSKNVEDEDNLTEETSVPNMSTANLEKLANTVFTLIQAKLLVEIVGGAGYTETELPQAVKILTYGIDWTSEPTGPLGKEYTGLLDFVVYNDETPTLDDVEILMEDDGGIGATIDGNVLTIPIDVLPGTYTLIYETIDLDTIPEIPLPRLNEILIEVTDDEDEDEEYTNPGPISGSRRTRAVPRSGARTPQNNHVEPDAKTDKATYPHNEVIQKENGLTLELDGTPEKPRFAVGHPGGRIEINDESQIILKSEGETHIISDALKEYINTTIELSVGEQMNIKAPKLFIEGDVMIDGTLIVTKEVTMEKDVNAYKNVMIGEYCRATEDVIGGGISLKGHKHSGVKSGSSTSGPPV